MVKVTVNSNGSNRISITNQNRDTVRTSGVDYSGSNILAAKAIADSANALTAATIANTTATSAAASVGAAFNQANAAPGIANSYATLVGTSGNSYSLSIATSIGSSGNSYANAVGASGNSYALSITNSIGSSSNSYANAVGAAGNSYTVAVGTSGNNFAGAMANSSNAYATSIGNSSNLYATAVGTAGNSYTVAVGSAGNSYSISIGTSGNAYATLVGTSGNSYATSIGAAGNSYASAVGVASNSYTVTATTSANNYAGSMANSSNAYALTTATNIGTAGNSYTTAVGTSGNSYAVSIGSSSNAYALSTATTIGTSGNSYTTAVGVAGNSYATSVGTSGNSYTVSVGTSGNNFAGLLANSANGWANTKLSTSGGTVTGDVSIVGNLYISGNSQFQNVTSLVIGDPLIYLASNNYSSDIVDIGFIANYVNSTGSNVHTGLYREHVDKMYYLFQGYDQEPANNHIGALTNNMTLAVLNADLKTSNLSLGGSNAIIWIKSSYDQVNSLAISANSYATSVGTSSNSYATAVGTSGNSYTVSVGASGNNFAGLLANSANAYALTTATNIGTSGNSYATAVGTSANSYATSVGTSGNSYAIAVGTSGNAYASSVGVGANSYAVSVGTSGNAYALSTATAIGTAGNSYATAVGTSGNAYTTSVALSANNFAGAMANSANAYSVSVGTSGNSYALTTATNIGTAGNSYATSVGTSGNTYASSVGVGANSYAATVGTSANNFAGSLANIANNLVVAANGTIVGARNILNFVQGANTTLSVTDDSAGNRINVTIASIGAGGASGNYLQNSTGTFAGTLTATGDVRAFALASTQSIGMEGGQIDLATAQGSNTSLVGGNVSIDIYGNKLRFFESGGTNRGAFIDMSLATGGVGSDLLSGAGGTDTLARATAAAAFDKANAANVLAFNALPNTTGAIFNGTLNITQNLSADRVITLNNGNGENFKVGDDAWIGDTNLADTLRIKGQQNVNNGYILFGQNDGVLLGRSGAGPLTYNANTVWHAGNDGTGSGLDADLLDGQHGTYYSTATFASAAFDKANSANVLAFNALPNTSGAIFNGTLFVSQNLSADKVLSSNNGLGENFKIGDDAWIGDVNIADTFRIKGVLDPTRAYIIFNNVDNKALGRAGSGALTWDGNTIWHAANDGTGSGLDADLLDGQHGTYYSTATFASAAFDKANAANVLAFTANNTANIANVQAFAAPAISNSYATSVGTSANAYATAVGTAGNSYTVSVGTSSNNFAGLMANSANGWANTKVSSSGGTITGDLSIVGNLYISGNSQFQNATSLVIGDPLIYLAANNYASDIVDIGFIANYVNATGSNVHTGLYREHEDKMYYLFQGYDKEPANNHIGALSNNMTLAVLNADIRTSNLVLNGANAQLFVISAYDTANAAPGIANSYATSVGTSANAYAASVGVGANTYALAAFNQANNANITAISAFNKANGAVQTGFPTIIANGNTITASSNASTLRIIAGTNIAITTDTSNITITSTATGGSGLANTSGVVFGGDLTITGNVGIGTAQTSNFRLEVNGAFAAQTKSFLIAHPTKPGMQLRYASLEGPENGVYVRGKSYNNTIELPDYWTGLVDDETITVHLTPFGRQQNLYVWRVANNVVYVEGSDNPSYYYSVWAERKDVEKLIVEI